MVKPVKQFSLQSVEYIRSVGCLVNLANQLLQLRSRLLQEAISRSEQPVSSYGECARLITAPLETLQPTIGQLNPDTVVQLLDNGNSFAIAYRTISRLQALGVLCGAHSLSLYDRTGAGDYKLMDKVL